MISMILFFTVAVIACFTLSNSIRISSMNKKLEQKNQAIMQLQQQAYDWQKRSKVYQERIDALEREIRILTRIVKGVDNASDKRKSRSV